MKREPETWEVWAKRVDRWRKSGLTCAEFSSEIGVKPKTLSFWDWRLRKDGRIPQGEVRPGDKPRQEKAMSNRPPVSCERPPKVEPMFMELVNVPTSATADGIEIVVRSVTVRVPLTATADVVARAFDLAEKQK